jgi:hypothetical protein
MDPEWDPRLFVRIRAALARKIWDGEYPAGAKLPTEASSLLSTAATPARRRRRCGSWRRTAWP